MKKGIAALLLAAVVLWSPVKGTDVGKLLPVELVQISRTETGYVVRTDTENMGEGETLAQAVENMRDTAQGEIFLETTEYVLLTRETMQCLPDLPEFFRPGTEVYAAPPLEDLEQASAFLRAHSRQSPLFRLMGETRLPELEMEGGRIHYADRRK